MSKNVEIPRPTDSEWQILTILWEHGPSTVRFVNDTINAGEADRQVGYTTTLKLMQIMFDKGLLAREKSGKTHIYRPAVSESHTQQRLVDRLLDTAFGGSAMKLVMQALGSRKSSAKELRQIRAFLDQLEDPEESQDA